jgi:hypothetical protein
MSMYQTLTECVGKRCARGATCLEPPTDKPYGDRSACVRDPFGNASYLNTFLGRQGRAQDATAKSRDCSRKLYSR